MFFPALISVVVALFKTGSDISYKFAGRRISDDKMLVLVQRSVEALIAILIIAITCFFLKGKIDVVLSYFTPKIFLLVGITAVLGGLSLYLNIKALRLGELSVVSPMSQLTPALLLLTSPLMVGDKVSLFGVFGVILVVIGSYVLGIKGSITRFKDLLSPLQNLGNDKGVKYALLASVINAVLANIDKQAALLTSAPFWVGLEGILTAFIFFIILRTTHYNFKQHEKSDIAVAGVPGVTGAISSMLQVYAMTLWQVPYVVAVKRLSTVFSTIVGLVHFKESYPIPKIIGSLVMLGGTVVIVLLG